MTHFPAQITTESGDPLADVEAWIERVMPTSGRLSSWHGGFDLPTEAGVRFNDLMMSKGTLGIKLSDGRFGKILVANYHQTWDINTHPDHGPAAVLFQGTGLLE